LAEDNPLEIQIDSGLNKIKLRAKNERDRNKWYDALRKFDK
jgi:hypothetical protein